MSERLLSCYQISRDFPLPSIQSGAMLGNGNLGVLLWGEKNILNITFGCASLWDHRGGVVWSDKQNFKELRELLLKGDEDGVKEMFAAENSGRAARPTLIPLGRIVLKFPQRSRLLRYEQTLDTGTSKVIYSQAGTEKSLEFRICIGKDFLLCGGLEDGITAKLVSAWELTKQRAAEKQSPLPSSDTLAGRDFPAPIETRENDFSAFVQAMPADASCSLGFLRSDNRLLAGFARGCANTEQVRQGLQICFSEVWNLTGQWWRKYWKDVPSLDCPDAAIRQLYLDGMYKYGCMTHPAGVPAGLQGPWIEDDRFPPWSGDYHFNINVQLCYSPSLNAGKYAHLKRLFDMILAWRPVLRRNAEKFAGIPDGYMLPHAVDDRCVCMGNFWTGCIDHACSAWVAMMMYDYCDYSGDVDFLRGEVLDFMQGVLRVFEAIMERNTDGVLALPVGVSPEYGGSGMDAWGRNASFQLAAIHRLARNLISAADWLGCKADPFALEIVDRLPLASLGKYGQDAVIALWEGKALDESHRHHSHLASLEPFSTIDPEDSRWQKIVQDTIKQWTVLGMGQWTGWCVPWASKIRTRLGQGEMAVFLLHYWETCFTNAGGASLHDAAFTGPTVFACIRGEIMQMDGCMGAVNAIQELFLFEQNGTLKVFYGIPDSWEKASFTNLHAPGGFLISGKFQRNRKNTFTVTATRAGTLKLQTKGSKAPFERKMKAGEKTVFAL